jgi:hypothetical protein
MEQDQRQTPEPIDQMLTLHDLVVRELAEIKGTLARLEGTLREIALGLGAPQPRP